MLLDNRLYLPLLVPPLSALVCKVLSPNNFSNYISYFDFYNQRIPAFAGPKLYVVQLFG